MEFVAKVETFYERKFVKVNSIVVSKKSLDKLYPGIFARKQKEAVTQGQEQTEGDKPEGDNIQGQEQTEGDKPEGDNIQGQEQTEGDKPEGGNIQGQEHTEGDKPEGE